MVRLTFDSLSQELSYCNISLERANKGGYFVSISGNRQHYSTLAAVKEATDEYTMHPKRIVPDAAEKQEAYYSPETSVTATSQDNMEQAIADVSEFFAGVQNITTCPLEKTLSPHKHRIATMATVMTSQQTTGTSAKMLREYAEYYNIDISTFNMRTKYGKECVVDLVNKSWQASEAETEANTHIDDSEQQEGIHTVNDFTDVSQAHQRNDGTYKQCDEFFVGGYCVLDDWQKPYYAEVVLLSESNYILKMFLLAFNVKLTATTIELYCAEISKASDSHLEYKLVNEADKLGTNAMYLGFDANSLFSNTYCGYSDDMPEFFLNAVNNCILLIQPILKALKSFEVIASPIAETTFDFNTRIMLEEMYREPMPTWYWDTCKNTLASVG
ncbi:hypothetical protein [Nostoc sp.]|uniref:hypothetical protein n=1 Tax=Nostoc sp. TaxID=1180 RepID=UPI002FFB0DA5